ncbi:hypothetical protein J2802_004426 [Paraburkholderia caribensis]|nr:hypothetical protein [Paraburkholderia caribensis]
MSMFHAYEDNMRLLESGARHNSAYVRLRPSIVIIMTLYVIVNLQGIV